jgi:hypothetical protein
VALAVLLDPVGQAPQAPHLGAGDLAAVVLDDAGELADQALDLGRGDILTCDEDALVE